MHAFQVILIFLVVLLVPLGPLIAWKAWHVWRFRKRVGFLRGLAPKIGFREPFGEVAEKELPDIPETDVRITGEQGGYRIDVFERLRQHRSVGTPTETETLVQVSGLQRHLPEFRIEPQTADTRFMHKACATPRITIAADWKFSLSHVVFGSDQDAIVDVLTEDVTALLREKGHVLLECTGDEMRFCVPEKLLDEDGIRELLDFAVGVAATLDER